MRSVRCISPLPPPLHNPHRNKQIGLFSLQAGPGGSCNGIDMRCVCVHVCWTEGDFLWEILERTCVSWSDFYVCMCVCVSHHKCCKWLIAPSSVVKCANGQRGLSFIYLIHGSGIGTRLYCDTS